MVVSPLLFYLFLGKSFVKRIGKSNLLNYVLSILIVAWIGALLVAKVDFLFAPNVSLQPTFYAYFSFLFEGQRWDGAVLFSMFYVLFFLRLRNSKDDHLFLLDSVVLTICILYSAGKIGCFLAGHNSECTGSYSTLPWAVHLPNRPYTYHPRQLYDSFSHIILFAIMLFVYKTKYTFKGKIALIYLIVSPIFCFFSEFISDNPTLFLGLTSGQVCNLLIFVIGVSAMLYFIWFQQIEVKKGDATS